jgi:hypothetical protein
VRILAHAFGARYDLPIPLGVFIVGGGVVVLLSFAMSGRRAQSTTDATTQADDTTAPEHLHRVGAAISLFFLAFTIWAGFVGSQEVAENIVPTAVWLLAWIVVPLSCGLVGDWTRPVNPFAALARLTDRPRLRELVLGSAEPVKWPVRLAWWPAVLLFFLAACGELVFNLTMTVPHNAAVALIAYALLNGLFGLLFGPTWLRQGELFSVLFNTWGRLGYFRFGAPGRAGFTGGLNVRFDRSVSRIAFVLLLLISVNFDGLLATPSWNRLENEAPGALSTHVGRLEAFRTLAFVALALVVAAVFALFAAASSYIGRRFGRTGGGLANLLPSLVPIAFGYLLVHNMQYVLVNGQLMAPLIGNPIGKDSWPVHLPYPFNDGYEIHNKFLPSAFYWYVGVVVIVAVHVVAVMIAHRRLAGPTAPHPAERRHEYPWLVAMVCYTMVSLWLIAQPLVAEHTGTPAKPSARPASTAPLAT